MPIISHVVKCLKLYLVTYFYKLWYVIFPLNSFECISTEPIITLKYTVHQTEMLHLYTSIKERYILNSCQLSTMQIWKTLSIQCHIAFANTRKWCFMHVIIRGIDFVSVYTTLQLDVGAFLRVCCFVFSVIFVNDI